MFFFNKPPKWNECKLLAKTLIESHSLTEFVHFLPYRGTSFRSEFQWTRRQGISQKLLANRRVRRQPHLHAVRQSGVSKF